MRQALIKIEMRPIEGESQAVSLALGFHNPCRDQIGFHRWRRPHPLPLRLAGAQIAMEAASVFLVVVNGCLEFPHHVSQGSSNVVRPQAPPDGVVWVGHQILADVSQEMEMADGAGNCGKDLCNRLQDGGAHVVNQSNGVPVGRPDILEERNDLVGVF